MSNETNDFLNEEYSILNNIPELAQSILFADANQQKNTTDEITEIKTPELNENENAEATPSDKNETVKKLHPFKLTHLCHLATLHLKNHKFNNAIDLVRCKSAISSKSEDGYEIKKLPAQSNLKHMKLFFETKRTDTNKPYFSSSCIQMPLTIELSNKSNLSSSISIAEVIKNNTENNSSTITKEISFENNDNEKSQTVSNISVKTSNNYFADGDSKPEALISNTEPVKLDEAPIYAVIVAIDFGTTYSGYAYTYLKDSSSIHLMKRWTGTEPGFTNLKIPTTVLFTPSGDFHSFGYQAVEYYHDLEPEVAKEWHFFEKFKMNLYNCPDLNKNTILKSSNGSEFTALKVFSSSLKWLKETAIEELDNQTNEKISNDNIKWVLTVPAIWKQPAKSFMREAAVQAGLITKENPEQLLIALEPEAASIFIRQLRCYQLVPEEDMRKKMLESNTDMSEFKPDLNLVKSLMGSGCRYLVVDCGGGTIDVTVHEINESESLGYLKEIYKASGGPFGSMIVDLEFEALLKKIFSEEFIEDFRDNFPTSFNNLMSSFECKKRRVCPYTNNQLNINLPFSFIDFYKKKKGEKVEHAIKKYNHNKEYIKDKSDLISWSSQGMLRLSVETMKKLFEPAIGNICGIIDRILHNHHVKNISFMFLVGGFAESIFLQQEIRAKYASILKIIIPHDVSLCILKGAVMFGLNPTIIRVRRCPFTYGIGILRRFNQDKHPIEKKITKNSLDWVTDIYDKFVKTNQSISVNETFTRRYATINKYDQNQTKVSFYYSENDTPEYVTDKDVTKCASIILDLSKFRKDENEPREIQIKMTFGETEITLSAVDVITGRCVKSSIEFLEN